MIDNTEHESTSTEQPVPQPPAPAPPPRPSNRNWVVIGVMAFALVAMIYIGLHTANKGGGMVGNVRGKAAPDFELRDVISGQKVKLSDYRGKAVVLNFWATWCPPCKEEIPWFVDLQKQYGPEGLAILSLDTDDDASEQDVVAFAQKMGINYPVMRGSDDIASMYGGVDGLPTTFYIGRDGKILDRVEGLHSHYEIESNIKEALAQNTSVSEQGTTSTPSGAGN